MASGGGGGRDPSGAGVGGGKRGGGDAAEEAEADEVDGAGGAAPFFLRERNGRASGQMGALAPRTHTGHRAPLPPPSSSDSLAKNALQKGVAGDAAGGRGGHTAGAGAGVARPGGWACLPAAGAGGAAPREAAWEARHGGVVLVWVWVAKVAARTRRRGAQRASGNVGVFFFLRSGVANSIRRIGEKIDATARHSPLFFAHTRAPTTNSRPVRPRQPPTLPRLCAMAAVGGDTIVRWREREKKGARFFGSLSHQKLTPPLSLLPVSPPRSSSSPTAPSSASWWRTWTTWRP